MQSFLKRDGSVAIGMHTRHGAEAGGTTYTLMRTEPQLITSASADHRGNVVGACIDISNVVRPRSIDGRMVKFMATHVQRCHTDPETDPEKAIWARHRLELERDKPRHPQKQKPTTGVVTVHMATSAGFSRLMALHVLPVT